MIGVLVFVASDVPAAEGKAPSQAGLIVSFVILVLSMFLAAGDITIGRNDNAR